MAKNLDPFVQNSDFNNMDLVIRPRRQTSKILLLDLSRNTSSERTDHVQGGTRSYQTVFHAMKDYFNTFTGETLAAYFHFIPSIRDIQWYSVRPNS